MSAARLADWKVAWLVEMKALRLDQLKDEMSVTTKVVPRESMRVVMRVVVSAVQLVGN